MLVFNEERTYGVEIEFLENSNYSKSQIAAALNGVVNCKNVGYTHEVMESWKLTTDSSCGLELVSPILKGRNGFEQIEKVCKVLNDLGIKVDRRCGLHIHHDVSDYEVKNFKNLCIFYTRFEKGFDEVMPLSRRANKNQYCKGFASRNSWSTDDETTAQVAETIERIKNASSIDELRNMFCSRYYKVNLQSFVKYGTVEFRHHSGTTEADKIINWVKLTQLVLERCKQGKVAAKYETTKDNLKDIFWATGVYRSGKVAEEFKAVAKFYVERAKKFAAAGAVVTA
jgi:hypothetical protein